MSEISQAVAQTLQIDGVIRVLPFDEKSQNELNELVLWNYIRTSRKQVTRFGDGTWFSEGNKLSISFSGVNCKFAYQLKSLVLGMYTHGAGEGMDPLSWQSIRRNIGNLKRLTCGLQTFGIKGFDEISDIPDLKIRSMLRQLIPEEVLQRHPSYSVALLSVAYWLRLYGLVDNPSFFDTLQDLLQPYTSLTKERRKSHAIVPIRILKKILADSEQQVELASKVFDEWNSIQQRLNCSISSCSIFEFQRDTYINTLSKPEQAELAKYHSFIRKLKRYTFVLVLAYTGMRYGEAMSLPDDAAIAKGGRFYLRTHLSKTTDGTQELEWVTNEITYKAVSLLSRVCDVYRERAQLMLHFHGDSLPEARRLNLQYGIAERTLFNFSPHKQSCEFAMHTKSSTNSFSNINRLFQVTVNAADIAELERMGCNYHSVGSNHKHFKKPYKNGEMYNFTAHQFRHTFAWFIVANRLGDLDDIKYQYKHLENCMTLVYSQRGYESMEDLIQLTESFSEFMVKEAVDEMIQSAEKGNLAGSGGQKFIERLHDILNDDMTTGNLPHFKNMGELLEFTAKFTSNFRGLSHGYCTKGSDCKVKNAADPSHCVYCDSYIATPKHLPHWLVIRQRCESQLKAFDTFPETMQERFASFSTALKDNLEAANTIIQQLTIKVREA